jgi:hypothetical protein
MGFLTCLDDIVRDVTFDGAEGSSVVEAEGSGFKRLGSVGVLCARIVGFCARVASLFFAGAFGAFRSSAGVAAGARFVGAFAFAEDLVTRRFGSGADDDSMALRLGGIFEIDYSYTIAPMMQDVVLRQFGFIALVHLGVASKPTVFHMEYVRAAKNDVI